MWKLYAWARAAVECQRLRKKYEIRAFHGLCGVAHSRDQSPASFDIRFCRADKKKPHLAVRL
jgi:hypothetical protein